MLWGQRKEAEGSRLGIGFQRGPRQQKFEKETQQEEAGGVSSLARQGLWARPQGEMVQGCLGAFVLCTSIISSLLGFPTSNCTHCSVSIALAQGWSGIMSH